MLSQIARPSVSVFKNQRLWPYAPPIKLVISIRTHAATTMGEPLPALEVAAESRI